MDSTVSFKLNGPNIVHETIDGETVVINLDSGNYYSLQLAGAEIWDLIVRGATVGQINQYIGLRYDGASESIEQGVSDLVSELQRQELIVPLSVSEASSALSFEDPKPAGEKPAFKTPVLEQFTDMKDLLLLDPVHEVDEEEGWPKQEAEEKA